MRALPPGPPGSSLALLSSLLCATLLAACGADPRPPHVILISIDTLRPDYLGCYGHARETSPTLDRIAAEGVRFADVTSASPWTLPSHATMLTGLFASHHGVKTHETRLSESVVTLAEEFQSGGYETFAVVNTHNVGGPQFQLGQGFGDHFRYIVETENDPRSFRKKVFNNGDTIVATAKEMLGERDGDAPFFLFLHFYDVHTDFTPRPEYRAKFVGPYAGRMTGSTSQLADLRTEGETLAEDDLRWLRDMYDAEINQLDDLLGKFFAWLDDEGLYDDALIVITSDHGEEFQEHGSFLHGRTHYQEILRIPLIVRGPGVPPGTVVATPVHGVDVTPTILALMGLESHMPRDGIDLSAAWRGGTLPERTFFAEADHNNEVDGKPVSDIKTMVRRGATKVLYDEHSGALELYDLGTDPAERTDLAQTAPQRVEPLKAELDRFRAGAIAGEPVPPPDDEERALLDALGY